MKAFLCSALMLAAGFAITVRAANNPPQSSRVTGKVMDAAGNPVAGAAVGYWQFDGRPPFPNLLVMKEQTTTSTEGAFEFPIPRVTGLLLARKAGLAPAWTSYLQPRNNLPEQRLVLTSSTVLAGKVLDDTGKPVANAQVFASPALIEIELGEGARSFAYLNGKPARACFSARTTAEGRFRIEGFPTNASVDLLVDAPGKALRLPSGSSLAGGTARQYVAGQENIELIVEPAGSLEGKITAEGAGSPLPIAWLSLQPTEPSPFGLEREPSMSGADGVFRINDVPAGSYRLHVAFSTNDLPAWVTEAVPVSVESGRTNREVKVQATRGGLLEVAVLNRKNRQPVAQASVSAYGRTSQFQSGGTAASDGIARLRLPPGEYQLNASAENARNFENTLATVEVGQTNRVEIELSPPPKISGIVRLPDNQPAAGAEVRVVPSFRPDSEFAKTDAAGKFEWEWNPERFGQRDFTPCLLVRDPERNLAVAQDIDEDTGPLELNLAPALTLAGRAEANGKPVTNVTAQLIFWTGRSGMHLRGLARTNTPGHFEIPALPPGRRYGVIISAPGHGQKQMTNLEISADPGRQELEPVELKLANLALAGQVLDMDDKPVTGISVSLSGEGQPNANARTDREGCFRFSQVCEGPARLYANAQNSYGSTSAEGGDTNVVLRLGQNYSSSSSTSRMLRLKGVVTDVDGKPVVGAQVAVFPTSGGQRVKTGTNGAFNLNWSFTSRPVQSANSLLVVRDTVRNLAATEALDEETTNLNVTLKPALTVAGLVTTPAGAPLVGAQVGLWLRAGNTYDQLNDQGSVADAQGHYEIKCLPPDAEYVIFATAKGHGRSQQRIQNAPETNRLELEPFVLKLADKVVAGQVVDENDKPVSGANVQVLNAISAGEGQPQSNVSTDSKGRFRLQVCEGQVRLITSSQIGIAQATVEAGDTNVVMTLSSRSASGARILGQAARRGSLKGSVLPDLAPFGIAAEATAAGKPLLICLLDAEQRPCRRTAQLLVAQHDALRQKGVAVLAIQAAVTSAESFQTWTNASPLPFPVGRLAQKSANTRWAAEVESLPWFILRDAQGKVAAEGFALDELDAKLDALKK